MAAQQQLLLRSELIPGPLLLTLAGYKPLLLLYVWLLQLLLLAIYC